MVTPADVPPQGSIYPRMTPALVMGPPTPPSTPTPEPEPTPASLPAVTVHAASVADGALDEAGMVALLTDAGWPTEWQGEALAVAMCESKWRPGAVGDSGNSLGLFQLWRGWAAAYGVGESDLLDPAVNARVALYVRSVRGRWGGGGGWSCADLLSLP